MYFYTPRVRRIELTAIRHTVTEVLFLSVCSVFIATLGDACSQVPYLSAGRHPVRRYSNSYFLHLWSATVKRALRLPM